MLFKFLIASFLLSSGVSIPDADGWVSIERPEKITPVQGADERDLSIWVVFAKQIGSEKIFISFPDEPTYRYMGDKGDEMEILCTRKGAQHRLQVMETSSGGEGITDFVYWKDGYWHLERLIAAEPYTYLLQTRSLELENNDHQTFVQSFQKIASS